jgi:Tfp pilus assembly protein PilF
MRRQADADKASVFLEVADLYQQALKMDPEDVETNFNMAILYLTGEYQENGSPDYSKAMHYLL